MKPRKLSLRSVFLFALVGIIAAISTAITIGSALDGPSTVIIPITLVIAFVFGSIAGIIGVVLIIFVAFRKLASSFARNLSNNSSRKSIESKIPLVREYPHAARRLIQYIARIEADANLLLDYRSNTTLHRSTLAIRSELLDNGFWSNEDVREFDEVLRVRNALVHGDVADFSAEKVSSAASAAAQIRANLQESIKEEPRYHL